jgi:hypothetical protein
MSDTPRTDVKIERICGNWNNAGDHVQKFVLADFARQLERELAAANQIMGELCESCGWAMRFPDQPCRCELEAALAAVKGEKL